MIPSFSHDAFFLEKIKSGTKTHTIRKDMQNHLMLGYQWQKIMMRKTKLDLVIYIKHLSQKIEMSKKTMSEQKQPYLTAKESLEELRRISPYNLIKMERIKQEAKFGIQNHDDFRWLAILGEEFGEVSKAVCEQLQDNYTADALEENLETELIQVAAVCVSWVECMRRRKNKEQIQ